MRFVGRGLCKPVVMQTVTESGVTFRANCSANPDSWASVSLSREELVAAVARIDDMRAGRPISEEEIDGVPGSREFVAPSEVA
jgi:hypothetical protein